jgi:hypothetical protein
MAGVKERGELEDIIQNPCASSELEALILFESKETLKKRKS